MTQNPLALDTPAAEANLTADPVHAAGFELGFDHARHGLVPPPGLLLDGTPVGQGWRAGRAVFGHRARAATAAVRHWLELRTAAWRGGIAFEPHQLTPQFLAQIRVARCPVLRVALHGHHGAPAAACVERLNPDAGYAAGNVATLAHAAAQARDGVDVLEAVRRARRAEATGEPVQGLDAGAWWRLAVLRSFATPLPFFEAAGLPLAVLPPNRVRLLNAVQGLQALLTQHFMAPGWGERLRTIGAALPEHTLRQDFNLWVGAMLPRVLEAHQRSREAGRDLRDALEDAWLAERVMRRWHHFALALGEAGVAALLERALALPLPGRVALAHGDAQAVDGWALEAGGRAERRLSGADGRTSRTATPTAPADALPAIRRRTARTPALPASRATAAPRRAAT
jgi:hypothetical protein